VPINVLGLSGLHVDLPLDMFPKPKDDRISDHLFGGGAFNTLPLIEPEFTVVRVGFVAGPAGLSVALAFRRMSSKFWDQAARLQSSTLTLHHLNKSSL